MLASKAQPTVNTSGSLSDWTSHSLSLATWLTSRWRQSDEGAVWQGWRLTGPICKSGHAPAVCLLSSELGWVGRIAVHSILKAARSWVGSYVKSCAGLSARQGSNGCSVCALIISLHLWCPAKTLLTSAQCRSSRILLLLPSLLHNIQHLFNLHVHWQSDSSSTVAVVDCGTLWLSGCPTTQL